MDRFDSSQLIKLIWSHSTDGLIIFEWDEDRQDLRVLKINRVARDLTSGTLQEGTLLCEALPIHRSEVNETVGVPLIEYYRDIIHSGQEKSAVFRVGESQVRGWWQNNSVPLSEGESRCLFMSFRNVTPLVENSNRFERLASTDPLTGLPNRRRLEEVLAEWICKESFVCVFIDLNKFKAINDNHGHLEADRVLQAVARRLNDCLIKDRSHVFRIAGDEFFMVWDCELSAPQIGDRVWRAIHQPVQLHSSLQFDVSAAIGIVEYQRGLSIDEIMKGADEQMYRSKRRKCKYAILGDWSNALYKVAEGLDAEMDNPEFLQLYYQPIYELGRMTIASWEALIRWPRPSQSMRADTIINAVQRYGLSIKFGLWTINRAQQDWQSWGCPSQTVAVNISPSWLESDTIFHALMDSQGIAVEVLEDERLESFQVLERIRALRDEHIMVYIDDFGKAYSSLGQLAMLGPDKVKVDMVITQDEILATGAGALMEALKIPSVAEGIDSDERLQAIRDAGYTYGQGYRLMMPRSAAEVRSIVGNHPH